jgi:hypothetical protein
MPFNLNTFAAQTYTRDRDLMRSLKMFKVHQRGQITSIRVAYLGYGPDSWDFFMEECREKLEQMLPNLSTIEFVIALTGITVYREDIVTRTEAALRQCDSTNAPINVKVKVLDFDSTPERLGYLVCVTRSDLIAWCSDN